MKKTILLGLILMLAGGSFSKISALETTAGDNGNEMGTFSMNVNDFSEIKVSDGVNVKCICDADSAGQVSFRCPREMASMILFTNKDNRLLIQLATEAVAYQGKGLPTITVYPSLLTKIENTSDSTVTVEKLPATAKLNVKVIGNGTICVHGIRSHQVNASITTGSGHIVVDGKTNRASLSNIGTGPIEAGNLQAEYVTCKVLGTGPVDCFVTEELKIMGMGSGKVIYDGRPKKVVNRSIGVKVIDLNAPSTEE